jgi:hypothetical protein
MRYLLIVYIILVDLYIVLEVDVVSIRQVSYYFYYIYYQLAVREMDHLLSGSV